MCTFNREITIAKAKSICEKEVSELFNIWDETGIRKEILNTYADQVLSHLVVSHSESK
jgi:hypothetical protein